VSGALVTSLKAVITEILSSREFQVTERDGFLLAKKGDVEVILCLIGAGEEKTLPAFLDRFRSFTGRKVVASLVPLPEIPPEKLDPGLIIWDREAVVHEIGRTRIEHLVGDRDFGLVDELLATDYPRMVSAAELSQLQEAEVGEKIIRPTIDVHDVKEIGMRTVGGFRHRLELVPYYVFDYSCKIVLEGAEVAIEHGRLSINALTKKVEAWNDKAEVVFSIEQGHRRLEPVVELDVAANLVRTEVVRLHTSERELVIDEGHVTVTERRKVAPRTEDVELMSLGVYYLPIWCVEGVHGVLIINAGTGKIVSEDYYKL
jgi:hypothetical protein